MKHFQQLDGIRGLAVIMVVAVHYVDWIWLYNFRTGVDLFFVLSGFLITGLLIEHKGRPDYFRWFFVRRACRVLPLYAVLVSLFFLLPKNINPWLVSFDEQRWPYVCLLQNFFMDSGGGFNRLTIVTWSLCVEEHFYLIMPFLIYILPERVVCWVIGFGVIFCPTARLMVPSHMWAWTPFRVDSILLGAALAIAWKQDEFRQWVQRRKRWIWFWFFALCLGAVYQTRMHMTNLVWFGNLYVVTILLALSNQKAGRVLSVAPLRWAGSVSYCVYLIHWPIAGLFHSDPDMPLPIFSAGLAAVTTLAIAFFSLKYFEQPITNWGRSITRSPKQSDLSGLTASFPEQHL